MSQEVYARANLFIGIYDHPKDGHIRLPETTRVRLMKGVVTDRGWEEAPESGDTWLIVDDGQNFWPVMVKLSEADDIVRQTSMRGMVG